MCPSRGHVRPFGQTEADGGPARTRASAQPLERLGLRRRQFTRFHVVSKATGAVRAIAERFIGRLPAAAQRNRGAAGQAEDLAAGVLNLKFALDANRAVVGNGDFGWHGRNRDQDSKSRAMRDHGCMYRPLTEVNFICFLLCVDVKIDRNFPPGTG